MRLDDTLLQEYMAGFYGYGDHGAEYWLLGMEEGSEGTQHSNAQPFQDFQGVYPG